MIMYTHDDLRQWGASLDREQPQGLGETLLCYAHDWKSRENELLAALIEIYERSTDHPAYAELTEEEEMDEGGDTANSGISKGSHQITKCTNYSAQSISGITRRK